MAAAGIGPRLYHIDQKVTVEEYLQIRPLSPQEEQTHQLVPELAFSIAKFNRTPLQPSINDDTIYPLAVLQQGVLAVARRQIDLYRQKPDSNPAISDLCTFVVEECCSEWYQALLANLNDPAKHQRVLGHNDFYSQNVVASLEQPGYRLLDFEYSNTNIAFFDLFYWFTVQFHFDLETSRFQSH